MSLLTPLRLVDAGALALSANRGLVMDAQNRTVPATSLDTAQQITTAVNTFDEAREALRFIVEQVRDPANAEYTLGAWAHGAGMAQAVAVLAKMDSQS